jgi:alpha-1,2-mannosyltransferase
LLGVLPGALVLTFLIAGKNFAFDFHQFWRGGRDVLDGVSPYPRRAALDAASGHLGPHGIQNVFRFPYPAGCAVLMAVLAWLPFHAAAVVLVVLSIGAAALALRLLDVRDWRCYGVMFCSIAVITSIRLGTLSPILLLLVALAWRYRDRAWIAGGSIAAVVVLKVFLWPLVLWLAATRRLAAAAIAAAAAVAFTAVAWAAIGFAGFSEYPHLLSRLTDVVADRGFSLVALGSDLGFGRDASRALPWIAGGIVLLAALLAARGTDGDRRSLTLAIAASILLTPIVWLHYFVLLYVPIALYRRALSSPWLLFLLLWATPFQETKGDAWRVAVGLAVCAATVWAATRGRAGLEPRAGW